MTFFDDLVLNPPPERAGDAPGFADTLAQVKAAQAQRRAEEAERIARWIGPPRQLTTEATIGDNLAVADPQGFNALLNDLTAQALSRLDAQVADLLASVPVGTRICVHGPEMLAEDADPAAWLSDEWKVIYRVSVHQLDDGEACTAPGTGGRRQHVRRDALADLLAARDAILDAPYRPDPPPILTRRSAELYNQLRAAPRDDP